MLHRPRTYRWLAAVVALGLLSGPLGAALPCDADLDDDGAVGVTDFLALLGLWGTDPAGPPDFNDDGTVGVEDFLTLLAQWGTDPGGPPDFDADGDVGVADFLILLAHWGPCDFP